MTVKKGDKVAIHYIGRLKDGSEFDNSYENGEPIKFEVGGGMVIPGFDEGVIGMEIGDKKTIVIPPEQAYGERDDRYVSMSRNRNSRKTQMFTKGRFSKCRAIRAMLFLLL